MFDISKKYDFKIKEMEVDKDHIHIMISSAPKISPFFKTAIYNRDMENV